MGRQLPAVPVQVDLEPGRRSAVSRSGSTRHWLRSPLADALVELVPDLLRLTRHSLRSSGGMTDMLPPSGANGMSVQEVEIDVASPLVRRIVVRTTNSWSLSPEVALGGKRGRGGRIGLGAVSVASILLLGAAAARRASIAFPGRPHSGS
jgi:hypothetical protein